MKAVVDTKLPAFYVDAGGRYGVVYNGHYICAWPNRESGTIDVTSDVLDYDGTFSCSQEWESFAPDETAAIVRALRKMLHLASGKPAHQFVCDRI